ncbi:PaaX family transcriptional regulator C-terminal domain-containing protein, partial [Planktotalea sp.]|uniref:PaaX family transcriptional regulator C-terminal domain-containing protein n=1 Tax=Planktotalea sp. TaxID=2029877 RepID=UPI0032998A30
TDAFLAAVRRLAGDQQPRVWSLVVSVFGDLAPQGDALSGAILSDILSPVGIRPEAMRVALHRLRNDGWIDTSKRGREAFHVLSSEGIKQSAIASGRIYASVQNAQTKWHILCYPPALASDEHVRSDSMVQKGYVPIGSGTYLANGASTEQGSEALVLQGELGAVPDWVRQSLISHELNTAFEDLFTTLGSLALQSDTTATLTAAQIATLRTLIVHRWRKLVLKTPNVPDALLGNDSSVLTCRAQVMDALSHLPKPKVSDLSGSAL